MDGCMDGLMTHGVVHEWAHGRLHGWVHGLIGVHGRVHEWVYTRRGTGLMSHRGVHGGAEGQGGRPAAEGGCRVFRSQVHVAPDHRQALVAHHVLAAGTTSEMSAAAL